MTALGTRFALRWRRTSLGLRLSLFLLGTILLAFLVYLQSPGVEEETSTVVSHVGFFILINLTVVVIVVMAFLIGRSIIKLIIDRKRRILGTGLRMRLVVSFLGLTLIPTAVLFMTASGMITNAMQGWFTRQVEETIEGAVEVSRLHYQTLEKLTLSGAKAAAAFLESDAGKEADQKQIRSFLEKKRKEFELFSIKVVKVTGEVVLEVSHAASEIENFGEPELDKSAVRDAFSGKEQVLFEEKEARQFVRAYIRTWLGDKEVALIASSRIQPELSEAMTTVLDSHREYSQLKFYRRPLTTSYLLIFGMITLILLFAAVWVGLHLAKEISVPIRKLARGTKAVAGGNYDFHIKPFGDDEISLLIESFNRMTSDLKLSRSELERRKLYIETIVSNLAVGVISVNVEKDVTLVNDAAARLFGLNEVAEVLGRKLEDVIPSEVLGKVRYLMDELEHQPESDPHACEAQLTISLNGRELHIICTAGKIIDSARSRLGTVLLFDDITELSKAQQMAAWREVARRIAHEIKNPLTPIQLSAQRLERLLGKQDADNTVLECTQTIVEHVDSIKRLANEFSHFARMPTAELKKSDLNFLISDTLAPYVQSHDRIVFQFIADGRIPEVLIDREQIRRMLINLIDNAVAAFEEPEGSVVQPKIVIRTGFREEAGSVVIEVSDNGPGISDSDKSRIFEPYFTTKAKGTGLGLAVVTSVVSDHQGEIAVFDNKPRGARFSIRLPLVPKEGTRRRFAGSGA